MRLDKIEEETNHPSLTVVIALTSPLVCDTYSGPSLSQLCRLVETVRELKENKGCRVLLVTGGAISMGRRSVIIQDQPYAYTQAIAAVGQAKLIHLYNDLFSRIHQTIGQLVMSQQDITQRPMTIRACLDELFTMNVIPLCHSDIQCEEMLAAMLAKTIQADYLFLCTATTHGSLSLGTGGAMMTTLSAIDLATEAGVMTLTMDPFVPDTILSVIHARS